MEYLIVNSVNELPVFDKSIPIFCDIETDDLYGPLRLLQVYQPKLHDLVYIVDIAPIGYDKDTWAKELINVEDFIMSHYTVWYNASYDLGTLNISPSMGAKHPEDITETSAYEHNVEDLFYAMKSAYPEFMKFGLKEVVTKLPYTKDMYLGIDTKQSAKGFVRGAYIAAQAYDYAVRDVVSLSLMWEDKKIQYVIENNLSYKVDMMSQAYALIYQQNGLKLHREMWQKELETSRAGVKEYTALLPTGFNPNSFKQVRALLETDKSDNEALITYALSDKPKAKLAEYIIKLKRFKKEVSYLESINFDKMYTKFNAAGAISGRFTAAGGSLKNGFNAQQIPKKFQKLFKQDMDGTSVIALDYSTLELRLACAIYNEPAMYEQLMNGEDLHTSMAILVSGKKLHKDGLLGEDTNSWDLEAGEYVTKGDRSKAKGVNFGYVFGMSAKTFQGFAFISYGLELTLPEATAMRDVYFKKYPGFKKYHANVWNNYKKPSFVVQTALGRKVKPNLGTDGINIPVQGTGAETTKLAVHYEVKKNPLVLKYIENVVHDAIYERVPTEIKQVQEEELRQSMLKGWTEISKSSLMNFKDIPMIVE